MGVQEWAAHRLRLGSSVVGTAEVDRTEIGSSDESKQEVEQSTEVE